MVMIMISSSGHCGCPPHSTPTFCFTQSGHPKVNTFDFSILKGYAQKWLRLGIDGTLETAYSYT